MKRLFLFFTLGLFLSKTLASEFYINFTATGKSSTIDSVVVQNITKGVETVLSGGQTLRLSNKYNSVAIPDYDCDFARIHSIDGGKTLILSVMTHIPGKYNISVYNSLGIKISDLCDDFSIGINQFRLMFPKGVYLISIKGDKKSYTNKFISQSDQTLDYSISPFSAQHGEIKLRYKSEMNKSALNEFLFETGDLLLFKGYSGEYTTLVSDIPVSDKTINFEFIECRDASGKNYAVTKIGKQIWMAENLNYLPVEASLPDLGLEDENDWEKSNSKYYYFYDRNKYGVMYNWYAAVSSIPENWHLPSVEEWNTLIDELGGNSESGKSLMSAKGWTKPVSGVTNKSCFTALPGGRRIYSGFEDIEKKAFWMCTSNNKDRYFNSIILNGKYGTVDNSYDYLYSGYNVRCVKNNTTLNVTKQYSIKVLSGDNQMGRPGATLKNPVTIRVQDSDLEPVVSYPVYFKEILSGKDIYMGYTDGEGVVKVYWTLGNTMGLVFLEAYLKNTTGDPVDNSRIQISAFCRPDLPTVSTGKIVKNDNRKALCTGEITNDGGAFIKARGVCWNSTGSPTVNDSVSFCGTGSGVFTAVLSNLETCERYYYRAYAYNSTGISYGQVETFIGSYDFYASPDSLTHLSSNGGSITVDIITGSTNDAEIQWEISSTPNWITAVKDSKNNKINLSVTPNLYPIVKEDVIYLSSKLQCSPENVQYKSIMIPVRQNPAEVVLNVTNDELEFKAYGDTIKFDGVYCNNEWTIANQLPSWCSAWKHITNDIKYDGLKVSVLDNPFYIARNCEIVLQSPDNKGDTINSTIKVIQEPSSHCWQVNIVINEKDFYSTKLYLSGYPEGGNAELPGFKYKNMEWGKTGWGDFIMSVEFKNPDNPEINQSITFTGDLPDSIGEEGEGVIQLYQDCGMGSLACRVPNWSGSFTIVKEN